MSKKHFIEIAAILRQQVATLEHPEAAGHFPNGEAFDALRNVAHGMADMFKRQNSNFDRARFLDACGVS